MAYLAGSFLEFFKMNLGIIFLKSTVLGYLTLKELDWIAKNEHKFSRLEMSLVIKLGRLIDKGIIEVDCRKPA